MYTASMRTASMRTAILRRMTAAPRTWALPGCLALAALTAACGGDGDGGAAATPTPDRPTAAVFTLGSDAFAEGESIPARHTCDGEGVSPPLAWTGAPDGTQSFAIIMDDPDAPGGTFTHWLLYDLGPTASSLPEAIDTVEEPADGLAGSQGLNDFGDVGYGGPCPPSGPPHRYTITLYALDATLDLDPGASTQQVLDAMEGHVLGEARLTGTYGR